MKKQLITLVALVTIPAISFAQTADEIIDKNIAAMGGADKIAAVKTMELEQTMAIAGMEITSKSSYVIGKSMRSDLTVMGQQITTVIDGDKGWAINPMQGGSNPQDMPAEAMKAAKNLTEPQMLQLAYVKENKYPYELIGKEKFNSKDAFNLKVTRPEGAFNYYIDTATYQLMGFKGISSQGEVSATFSDFKAQDGLTIPYTSEITAPMAPGPITAKVTKLSVNVTVDSAIFSKPK